jgi:hypothetical protein
LCLVSSVYHEQFELNRHHLTGLQRGEIPKQQSTATAKYRRIEPGKVLQCERFHFFL